MKKNVKIAIITGITSFLGRNTAKYLLNKGYVVFGIIRPDSSKNSIVESIKGLSLIKLDFNSLTSKDFSDVRYSDAVRYINTIRQSDSDITFIHFAWGATLNRNNFMDQMLNIDMSKKVLDFASLIGANRFIFAGSQAEYSDSAYGMAKREFANFAVNEIKKSNMNFIHFRIFSIYGPDDRETTILKSLVNSIKENKSIDLSSCNFKWNFLYIDDFTNILCRFIENNVSTGIFDIASDDTRLLKEFVLEAHKVLSGNNKLNFEARPDSLETFAIPNISKTIESIGNFNFIKFSDGIKKI